jgi:RNA polymerase sigma factor (sigma-70 family)
MIKTEAMHVAQQNDAELVTASLAGSQDAFRQIVERYQTLICSLAYCATGSVNQSEDLAQETFVTAWKDLAELREPAKLRSWLCAIVRFRISNQFRRQGREPVHVAETLDAVDLPIAPERPPSAQAITNEETAILWRSLERIPESYREPLVLFYREHQSIETVAANLELSEDAVKQRLSRGRKMLQEQVLAFVEGALKQTAPGTAFTIGVLTALPAMTFSAKAAALGAAAKGGAAIKGGAFGSVLGILLGPAIGAVAGYLGFRAGLRNTRTPRERAFAIRYAKIVATAVIVFVTSFLLFTRFAGALWKSHPAIFMILAIGLTLAYGIFIFVSAWRYNRTFAQMRDEEREHHPEMFRVEPLPLVWEYRSRATLFGLPLVHCRGGKAPGAKMQPAVGWIAFGEVAYGILYASGAVAVGPISSGGIAIGIISFGGFGIGLLAFGGLAFGGVALGGAAIGLVASGGIALGWHAALGGVAAAHELALGGVGLANHVNDPAAREFFIRHHWLDFTQGAPRNVFWTVCFAPVILQMAAWNWWRRKMLKRATR